MVDGAVVVESDKMEDGGVGKLADQGFSADLLADGGGNNRSDGRSVRQGGEWRDKVAAEYLDREKLIAAGGDADDQGNVSPPASIADQPAELPARPRGQLKVTVKRRFEREGRWVGEIEAERDEMMAELKSSGSRLDKEERQEQVYAELDAKYPRIIPRPPEEPTAAAEPPEAGVSGLGDIPASWGSLPANASLAAEIQWVQASRLDVVEEMPSGATRVHLDRADQPAPSKAAIGWLETSIRAYSKYCDIAARATAQQEDATEHVRRERLAIADIRSLLAEMVEDDTT